MKSVEERLKALPQMADSTGLQADEALKRKILRAAREKKEKKAPVLRWVPALCCAVAILIGVTAVSLPSLTPAGPQPTHVPLIDSLAAGSDLPLGNKLALDVPPGSITIRSSSNPSFRSIWAPASGGNFPLIGVNGRYYRMLTNPTSISSSLLGGSLGTVEHYTSEPALAGGGICSNVVSAGETVYAVSGMNGAMAAAKVNGVLRVFQRVSFGDNALVGGERLNDTLKAGSVVALELTGVGTINDSVKAKELLNILLNNASFLRSGGSETNRSLLIQLSSGLVLQMAVNGERVIACGTWACPEFFDAFQEALQ
ncbi:MAG: hypothetical protein E7329_04050 [Clostridiales bacterium]|nr:hypothetical protein [Clostridiales bacterium]